MISALPPKAKITALVCSGRRRPKFTMPCAQSKFSAGKASWKAMITPTRKPTTPQKAVAITPARTTPSMYSFGSGELRLAHRAQHHDERRAAASITSIALTMIGQVARVIGGNRGQHRDHAQRDQFNVIPHFASLRLVLSASMAKATRPGAGSSRLSPFAGRSTIRALIHINPPCGTA